MAPAPVVGIFYASQTGTAEETAWELAREGRRKGYAMEPLALDETSIEELRSTPMAIFVVSTTGQGDPPQNMRRLWQELVAASLPPTLLRSMSFAVFGLGDRRYREFNYAARKLHNRLQSLGATPFFRLGLGDDQHDFGMEQELDPWSEGMWAALHEKLPPGVPEEDVDLRYEVEELGEHSNGDEEVHELPEECFWAELLQSRSLCTASHASEVQDVWNIRLRLPPGQRYVAGDVLVVWPRTDEGLVRRFVVETVERSLTEKVRIRAKSDSSACPFPSRPLSLAEVFSCYIDVTALPSRHFFHVLSQYTSDELHKKKLSEFASRSLEAKDALYEYCKRERRSAAEVMWDFWTARPPLNALLSALPLLRPRRYSIASSPGWAGPGRYTAAWSLSRPFWLQEMPPSSCLERMAAELWAEVPGGADLDLCVGIVNSLTRSNRQVKGLCSNFMKDAAVASQLLCSLEKGTLQLPPLQVPLILVCPGTGLSPCRALVQERHQQVMACKSLPSRFQQGLQDLMFLGFRHQEGDYLYGSEWSTFQSWLSVHVAFSRDHEDKKVYVQDLIEEQGQHVRRLLDAGAMIFVCGRSHPMPSQVFDAFAEVVSDATQLRAMQRSQRYICDTWG